MAKGGVDGSRGYIFQAIIALIECLEKDRDWDAIKNEPVTKENKVDIMLYKEEKIISAIQVKSSVNPFERSDVSRWLESLEKDAEGAQKITLCLVGDEFSSSCERFIKEHSGQIETVSFKHLQSIAAGKLTEYIKRAGLGGKVRVDNLELIDASLFNKVFTNSISEKPVRREDFEEAFKRAIPQEKDILEKIIALLSEKKTEGCEIPQCLTSIPLINKETGLVGREDIVRDLRKKLEENSCIVLVNGLGGIGKTAVMLGICNDLKAEGKHVAWIRCGDSLREDLLMLREGLGIPKEEKEDAAYIAVKDGIKKLGKKLYLFLDDLSRHLSEDEKGILNGLGIHVMATSRFAHNDLLNLPLDVLAEESALDMFYGYYLEKRTDKTPVFKDAAREIIRSVQSHTLLVELLAKAASKKGGTLETFRDDLKKQGVFDVFKRNLDTKHDKNKSIEECVIELYKISELTPDQQHIMKLFTIFTPEKEIYYMIGEWAGLNLAALDQLVELGWLEQVGPESGYQIHQIVRDSIARQMEKKGETVRLEEYGELLDRVIDTKSYLGKRVSYQKIRERLVLAEDLARFIENSGRVDVYKVALFNNIGGVLGNQGDNEKVLSYLEIEKDKLEHNQLDILSISKYIFNPFPVQRVYSRIFLGNYRTFVKIVENKLDPEYLDALSTYDNMTRVYHIQDIQEKEKIRRFPAINKHELGEEHQNTPSTYNNMAWLSDNQGSYKKALKYYQKALEAAEQLVNLEIPVRELIYINMALVYFAQDDYGNALKFFNLAYDKCLSKNIENDPHIQEMKTIIRFLEALRSN